MAADRRPLRQAAARSHAGFAVLAHRIGLAFGLGLRSPHVDLRLAPFLLGLLYFGLGDGSRVHRLAVLVGIADVVDLKVGSRASVSRLL